MWKIGNNWLRNCILSEARINILKKVDGLLKIYVLMNFVKIDCIG